MKKAFSLSRTDVPSSSAQDDTQRASKSPERSS
jgi:hypothetical protein